MKTYEEMIQFIAAEAGDRLRYNEWPAVMAIADAYEVPETTVFADVAIAKACRELDIAAARRARARAANEERRLANLARKQETE